jgi:hypothetical protein
MLVGDVITTAVLALVLVFMAGVIVGIAVTLLTSDDRRPARSEWATVFGHASEPLGVRPATGAVARSAIRPA